MEQQLNTMLSIEKYSKCNKSIRYHSKRRLIADGLHKLHDDEKISDDVFALTMNIFDRFINKYNYLITDRYYQLVALSCYNLAKKLRTNILINNENEQTSFIFLNENYTDQEIFDTELFITEILDWDLSVVVPHDYIQLIFQNILPKEADLATIRSHVHSFLSIAICELNTLTILPSLLCCACIQAAIRGLEIINIQQIDGKIIHCKKSDIIHTQRIIEQLYQTHLQATVPTPTRRCLAPIDTINRTSTSPHVK